MANTFLNINKPIVSQDQEMYNPNGSLMTTTQANDSLERAQFEADSTRHYNVLGRLGNLSTEKLEELERSLGIQTDNAPAPVDNTGIEGFKSFLKRIFP